MRQVPAGGGLLGQHLGSGAIGDKIPVDFGRTRMSWRGDKGPGVMGRAGSGLLSLGAPHSTRYAHPPPEPLSKIPSFFKQRVIGKPTPFTEGHASTSTDCSLCLELRGRI